MDTATVAALLSAITLIWSIFSATRIQQAIARTNRLHDQSVQRLYRARDAMIAVNKANTYLAQYFTVNPPGTEKPQENSFIKFAEMRAAMSELEGIAIAIGDKKLLDLLHRDVNFDSSIFSQAEEVTSEMSKRIHTRITELLQETSTL